MEHNRFIQQLQQFAELKPIKTAASAAIRESAEPAEIWRNGQLMQVDSSNNPTWGFQVKRLKTEAKACEDCGKECKNRTLNKTLYAFPKKHWRTCCTGCTKVFNPESKSFDLMPQHAQVFFTKFLTKKNK
jgi:hypothetical protein